MRLRSGTAGNAGAKFSDFGYATLIQRSEGDSELAVCLWSRPEIPRRHLVKLFADASEAVRARFVEANRNRADLIRDMAAAASERFQAEGRERSETYKAAHATVQALHDAGELSEERLAAFARADQFDETAIALSFMMDLPIGMIERTLVQEQTDQVLIMSRALGLSWNTVKALLRLAAEPKGISPGELEQLHLRFTRLAAGTASTAIQFYRLRERTAAPAR